MLGFRHLFGEVILNVELFVFELLLAAEVLT